MLVINPFKLELLLSLTFSILIFGFSPSIVLAQCGNGSTSYAVDLTGDPSGEYISPLIRRDGDNNCVSFSITTNPAASGILFSIFDGAEPGGALTYQINCGPEQSLGQPICLTGPGPYVLTFCKPGGNRNRYKVTSIAGVVASSNSPSNNSVNNILCEGATLMLTANTIENATYSWTGPNGFTSNLQNPVIPNVTQAAVGTYTVQATQTGACPSPLGSTSVSINSNPPSPLASSNGPICEGGTLNLMSSTVAGATYNWTGPNGFTSTLQNPSIPNVVLARAGDYYVSATVNGCTSSASIVSVMVKPVPVATATPTVQTICSGESTAISLASNVAGTTYSWTVVQSGVTGATNGTGNTINQALTATGTSQGTVTYNITPEANGCTGATITVTITVNPRPVINPATSNAETICSGGTFTIPLTSNIAGTTYSWAVAQSGVTGAIPGSGNSINQSLQTTGQAVGTATYTVTPRNNGCDGAPYTIVVTVNPLPQVSPITDINVCSGVTVAEQVLSSLPAGATFTWTNNNTSIGLGANGTGNVPSFTANNAGTTNATATISVTPTLNGCTGPVLSYRITVRPLPMVATTLPDITVCANEVIPLTSLSSSPSGATFTWTNSNPSIGLAGSGTGNIASFTAINNTISIITATIIVTPTLNGCAGLAVNYTITINPIPPSPLASSNGPICEGGTLNLMSSTVAGATYNWTGPNGFTSTLQNPSIPNVVLARAGDYYVSATVNGCTSSASILSVMVKPVPVATATPTVQTICSGESTAISLASNVAGTTYSWTVVQSGVTGATNGTGNTINQALTATGTSQGTVTYNITPEANGCTGATITVTITVNPRPVINPATSNAETICSGGTFTIPLTSNIAGTTYSWAVAQSGVTGAIPGSGNSINQSLQTTGQAVGTATYTVTPRNNGCDGAPYTIVVTVNPLPQVSPITDINVCSGVTVAEQVLSSLPAGATFTWTNNNTSIGLGANGTGNVPSFTASNAGTTNATATISVTPTLNGCTGPVLSYRITVRPLPIVAAPANITITSGDIIPIQILNSSPSGATFTWTNSNTAIGLPASGTGNVPSFTAAEVLLIPVTSTITITPTLNGCIGASVSYTITVNPRPIIQIPLVTDVINCGFPPIGGSITLVALDFFSPVSYSIDGGVTFQLIGTYLNRPSGAYSAVIKNSIGRIIYNDILIIDSPSPPPPPSVVNSGAICEGQTLTLSVNNPDPSLTYNWIGPNGYTATGETITRLNVTPEMAGKYAVTARITANDCESNSTITTVVIKPLPIASVPSNNVYCPGETVPATTFDINNSGAIYNWTVSAPAIGLNTTGNGDIPSFIAANTGTNPIIATITVTPTLNGCTGNSVSYTVTVKPRPVLTATPMSRVICSGETPNILLTSNLTGTTYRWTVVKNGVTGGSAGTGDVINQPLGGTGTAVYTIIPTTDGCDGAPVDVTITINPIPVVQTTVADNEAICSGSATNIPLNSNVTGTTFAWTVVQNGVMGASSGTGNNISQILSTTGATEGTAVYTITPTANNCVGTPLVLTLRVKPLPVVTVPASFTVCAGSLVSASTFTSVPTGATYDWTNSNTAVGLVASGGGEVPAFFAVNNGTTPITTTITVTPTLNGCVGAPVSYQITVTPLPKLLAVPNVSVCEGGVTAAVTLSSIPAGATYTWTNSNPSIGLAASGTGDIPSFTAINTGVGTARATITIIPTLNGCPGPASSYEIAVNKLPVITLTPSAPRICLGEEVQISASGAVSYVWSPMTSLTFIDGGTVRANPTSTTTYTVTGTDANGCVNTQTVTVTVNPRPVLTATPSTEVLCSGETPNIVLTSNLAGTTYRWTVVQNGVTGGLAGTGDVINQPLGGSGTAVYTIIPTADGCDGDPVNVTITINPRPVVQTTVADNEAICSGSTTNIPLNSNVSGTTYAWTVVQNGVMGASSGTGNNISQILSTTGATEGTAVYTITPTANNCVGTPLVLTLRVKPLPVVTVPASFTVCAGSLVSASTFTSVPTGATYDWTNSNTAVGLVASGGGEVPAFFAVNNGTTPITTTITVTPTLNGCVGAPVSYQITVTPLPKLLAVPNVSVCEGGVTAAVTLSSIPAGATYTWTNSNPSIGLAASGTGDIPSFTAINTGVGTARATITIIPTLNGCPGPASSYEIAVNKLPVITLTPSAPRICLGEEVQISASGAVSYVWSPMTSLTFIDGGTVRANPTSTTTYTVTGTDANGCVNTQTVTVTVNPTITLNTIVEPVSCKGGTDGKFNVNISGGTAPFTISYVNSSGLSSEPITANSGNNVLIDVPVGTYSIRVIDNFGCLQVASATVTEPSPITATHISVNSVCKNSLDGSVTVSPMGGNAPYRYQWINQNSTSATLSNIASGTYTVVITDAKNCTLTYEVTILGGNCTPVANVDSFITLEETPITGNVGLNDTDPDGDLLSFNILTNPANGRIVFNQNGTFTFTPNKDWNGTTTFTYRACDPAGLCNTATVTILVNPTNDPPLAKDDSFTGREDVVINGTVITNDADIDGDVLTFARITDPANGTLVFNTNGTFTFTPNANWNGTTAFTYRACDPAGLCSIATVTILVNPTNDPPLAQDDSFTGAEDVVINGTVITNDTDIDGDVLTYTRVTNPSNGTLIFNANGTFTFTPNLNWNGTTTFDYRVCDPMGFCDVATVTLTVTPTNDPPLAQDDSFTGPEDVIINGTVITNDTDIDGDVLTFVRITEPANGTLVFNTNGTFTFTPNKDWNGTTTFTYRACDPAGLCNTATVTILVNPTNDPPLAKDDSFTGPEDVVINGTVITNDTDIDGDVLTFDKNTDPANGTLVFNTNGTFTFTPNANWNGTTAFTYRACDPAGLCSIATVTILVNPTNDPPLAQDDSFTGAEDVVINGTVITNDTDIDGDVLTYTRVTNPSNGTLIFNANGTFTFTPNLNWNGTTIFDYRVCDPMGFCDVATVTLTVTPTNDPPIALDDFFSTLKNTTLIETIITNDSDIDGDVLLFRMVTEPRNGTLVLNTNGTFTYTPNVNFTGKDTYTYNACDPSGLCDNATVTILVQPQVTVNLTPQNGVISEGQSIKVTATLTEPLLEDVFVTLQYEGNANRGLDYNLNGSFTIITFLAGEITSSDSLTLNAKNDDLKEGQESVLIGVGSTSSSFVLIGASTNITITDAYPVLTPTLPSENSEINPDPLTSPNEDGRGNDAFIIYNISQFPDNEVIIFNRLGNEVYRIKNYDNEDKAFKGFANTGILTNTNKTLVDGVYFYVIYTTVNDERKVNKGYLILKR